MTYTDELAQLKMLLGNFSSSLIASRLQNVPKKIRQLNQEGEISSNILFLGDCNDPLFHWLRSCGEAVVQSTELITPNIIVEHRAGFLVSYGYRHIISKEVLDLLPNRAINLHISYLPWNRGADPNLWSFVENTPKGVTIHYIDEGLDTGDIIVQEMVHFDPNVETLSSSYQKLHEVLQKCFKDNWKNIKSGKCNKIAQRGIGSYHRSIDKEHLLDLCTMGWDTPLYEIIETVNSKSGTSGRRLRA